MVVGYPLKPSSAVATGQPTSAAVSSSGASGTGASTPTTLNHCPPNHTRTDRSAVARPSRRAALAPRTTAGYRAVAALSQAPLTTLAPTVPSRSVRYTWTSGTVPVAVTAVTGAMRPTIATDSSGRCESLAEQRLARADPQQVRAEPGELAVEVGVAGGGDADDRHHRGDADRDAQRGQHHPQGARAQPGRPHPGDVAGAQPRRSRYPARVHATTFPSRISTRRGRLAAMSRSWVMTTTVVPAACSSRSRSSTPVPDAESRLPVGSSARTSAGSPTTARAIATRCFSPPESWCGRWVSRCSRPTRHSAATARRRRSRTRTPAYSRPSATLSIAGSPGARWNCWKTNPTVPARSAASCRSDRRATSCPAIRTRPAEGRSSVPMTWSIVDLPEPDGPMMPTSSPYPMLRDTPSSAATPPGYRLVTSVNSTIISGPPRRYRR